jgi:ABC-type amino acid transport substrate-binding protein
LPTEFERQDYAFALPPDSPIREAVNQAILRIIASPEWEEELVDLLGERSE